MRFSVIIPCFFSEGTLDGCLASLAAQSMQDFEAIAVDSTPCADGSPPAADIVRRYEFARYHHHPARLSSHAARNLGARLARGRWLAFLDPDMTADPLWLETLSKALEDGYAVVGGGVDCPPGFWAAAVHLTKYGWWLGGGRPRLMPQLPSGNLALARSLFMVAGGFPDRYWEGDTALSYRLRTMGHSLRLVPSARVVHHDLPSAGGFLRERFLRGYDSGLARSERLGWSLAHRRLRAAVFPLTWLVMLLRSARYAAFSGWLSRWLLCGPILAAGLLSWVLGESLAYLNGRRAR